MTETTNEYKEQLRKKLSETFEDPFQIEVLVLLDAIHRDLHYAEKNREKQADEIIGKLSQLKLAIENQ